MQHLKLAFLMLSLLPGMIGQQFQESRYTIYDTPMTWPEAVDACKQGNSFLVNSHPDIHPDLHQTFIDFIKKYPKRTFWIGKSLTPWVILQGCVKWKLHTKKKTAVYKRSKYNQMSECAAACIDSVSFLLQRNSCYCLNKEENKTVTYVPYKACNVQCPGMSRDKCGGRNVYTYYEYYHGEITRDNEMYNCVSKKNMSYIQCDCDVDRAFTCEMTNGTKVSFKANVPGRNKSLSYMNAINFCRDTSGGLRLSPIPKFNLPYFCNEYWTTITRDVDWNYDTVSQRRPALGGVAMIGEDKWYREEYKVVSEKHAIICQSEAIPHEMYTESDVGNITSSNYPRKYKHNQLYQWHIELNDSRSIHLVFEDINLEDSTGCVYDYILVIENNRSQEKLCGKYKEKEIVTSDNTVTVVFRSDNTNAGTGFRMFWTAIYDQYTLDSEPKQKPSHGRSLSGGAVVGITVVVAVIVVVVASFIACLLYRNRHKSRSENNLEETSNVHNMAYAMSSFNTGSILSSDNSYLTLPQTHDKQTIKSAASYATDPKKAHQVKVDDNYLNAGLASDIRGPHYDHIDSSHQDHQYTHIKKTKMTNFDDNEYVEMSNI